MKLWVALLLFLLALPAQACDAPRDLGSLRGAMLALTNAERAELGLHALRMDTRLGEAAQVQACRMADRERLTHRGSWFAGLGRRLRRVDYAYAIAIENIGEGHRDAAEIVRGWMESPEHRVNMVSNQITEVGFGVALAENGRLHWSMVGAAPRVE